jgi:hypothetical protein
MPTAHGMEPKAMPQNPLPVNPNICPCNKDNYCLTASPSNRTGHLLINGAVFFKCDPYPPYFACVIVRAITWLP